MSLRLIENHQTKVKYQQKLSFNRIETLSRAINFLFFQD